MPENGNGRSVGETKGGRKKREKAEIRRTYFNYLEFPRRGRFVDVCSRGTRRNLGGGAFRSLVDVCHEEELLVTRVQVLREIPSSCRKTRLLSRPSFSSSASAPPHSNFPPATARQATALGSRSLRFLRRFLDHSRPEAKT